MVPFVTVDTLHLGPIPLHAWGLVGAFGFALWDWVATRQARSLGYDLREMRALQIWGSLFAAVFAHVLDVLFYAPEELRSRPWAIFFLWERLSSMGGFIGCVVGGVLWKFYRWEREGFRIRLVRRATPLPLLPLGDVIVSALPLGMVFGRAACAIAHDHPGVSAPPTELFAVGFPRGPNDGLTAIYGPIRVFHGSDPRYDLGLLECLYLAVVAIVIGYYWLRPRRPPVGMFAGGVCIAYGVVRFGLDFLRAPEAEEGDRRLGSLTFAQWSCFAMVAFGVGLVLYARRIARSGDDVATPIRARPARAPLATAGGTQ
jgi:phosphatidylglycerol:prolipoprotein diacylglycerol transferase